MSKFWKILRRDARGASAVEYALAASILAVAGVAGMNMWNANSAIEAQR